MSIAQQSIDDALDTLGSSRDGLSSATAQQRLATHGLNQVEPKAKEPAWILLAREFSHFFALILWLAATLALIADHVEPGQGMAQLGIAIIGVIFINGGFSFWQAHRAEQALAALRQLLPQQVTVRRDGKSRTIDATQLVPGDILQLGEGCKVPADCRIIESWGLRINLSTLTGESNPRAGSADIDTSLDPLRAHNLLLAGTLIVAGECSAVVYATGKHSEFGRIAHLIQTTGDSESPLQQEIRRISHLVAMLALGLGAVFFLIGHAIGLPWMANAMFTIGIIVANVPEGLLPSVTLSLAMATQRMARRNALVRHLPAVETLGSATVILTDKTGTLTQNRMSVREAFVAGQHQLAAKRWPHQHDQQLRRVARICHSLKFVNGEAQGDPMEIALWQFAGESDEIHIRRDEIAFDADRRRMSVITQAPDGSAALWCKGAPENVLPLCSSWLDGEQIRTLDEASRERFCQAQADMADRGMRVLALAWKALANGESGSETELQLCGLIGLEDPARPDVHEAVNRCHAAGVRIIMVTGDNPRTALALAREVEIVRSGTPQLITGEMLRQLSPAGLQAALNEPEILFARVSAEQKMQLVQALQQRNEIVAVTGDGVNDAPALKTADIGIAMGLGGTDVARESADIVLLDDHFATIVNAIEEGRAVYDNIRKFLTYILTSNIPELVPYLAFIFLRIPLPLTVIQILAIDLGTDMLPALALGAEPPSSDGMQQPPRPRQQRLLSWPLLARAYLFLGPLEAAAAMLVFFRVLHHSGWQSGTALAANDPLYLQATSACLMAIVLAQIANVLVCRHPQLPVWHFSLIRNRLLLWGLASECLLLLGILYTPPGQALFATAAPPAGAWLWAALLALTFGVLEEGRKALLRHYRQQAGQAGTIRAKKNQP